MCSEEACARAHERGGDDDGKKRERARKQTKGMSFEIMHMCMRE